LACLNEKELWFSRQRRAAISSEERRDVIQLVLVVFAVQISQFTVRQNGNQKAVKVRMVELRNFSDLLNNFMMLEVFENGNIEVKISQCVRQILTVYVGASPAL